MRRSSGVQRRQLWLVLALVILLVIVSWSVVAVIDGVTHHSAPTVTPTPSIERTSAP